MMKLTLMLKLLIMADSGRGKSGTTGGCGGIETAKPTGYFYPR